MVTIDEFSRLTSEIYACAIAPERWLTAIASISRTLRATGGGILIAEAGTRSVLQTNVPTAAKASYVAYYRHIDYVLGAVETGPVGVVRTGPEIIAPKSDSEFGVDWMRPHQMDDGLFVRLTDGALPTCFLVAAPRLDRGRFEPFCEPFCTGERIRLVSALVPHLQQALHIQHHLRDLDVPGADHDADDDRARTIVEAIDVFRHGIVVVGPGHRIVHANCAAEQILRSGDGLRTREGRLEATRAVVDTALQRSIAAALCAPSEPSPRSTPRADSLVSSRPSGKRPYVIHILPMSTRAGPVAPRALVAIIDPAAEPEPPAEVLRRLYGLTNAEANVALQILRCEGVAAIAEELSLSPATVRTHLRHIFEKTGTHRQTELVRLLTALTP
jgi:DNA-binding CsgD family transcriptional regulator